MDEDLYRTLIAKCETEQLQYSGAIQAHGALLLVDGKGLTVCHASGNLFAILGIDPESLLGMNFESAGLPIALSAEWLRKPAGARTEMPGLATASGRPVDVIVTNTGDGWIVELCRAPAATIDPRVIDHHRGLAIREIPDGGEVPSAARLLTTAVREIAGFDRVMLYRFLDDWSGEVIAENLRDGVEGFRGLRFPASDIPKIARDLYLLTPFRFISDSSSEPVPLISLRQGTPDLTYADLRSVSPLHLEYLRNMGVVSSFSIPIVVQKSLWGLVACHHLEEIELPGDVIRNCTALAGIFSLAVADLLTRQRLEFMEKIERFATELHDEADAGGDFRAAFDSRADGLLELIPADSGALVTGDDTLAFGRPVPAEAVAAVDAWFAGQASLPFAASDRAAAEIAGADRFAAHIAGFCAVRVGGARLYWFRQESVQKIEWAGRPDKTAVDADGELRLSPRKSFATWVETRSGFADAWRNENRMAAKKLAALLREWPWLG